MNPSKMNLSMGLDPGQYAKCHMGSLYGGIASPISEKNLISVEEVKQEAKKALRKRGKKNAKKSGK